MRCEVFAIAEGAVANVCRARLRAVAITRRSCLYQLKDGATDPLFIASETLKALEESEPEPPKAESAKQPLPFSQRWSHLIRQKKGPGEPTPTWP